MIIYYSCCVKNNHLQLKENISNWLKVLNKIVKHLTLVWLFVFRYGAILHNMGSSYIVLNLFALNYN